MEDLATGLAVKRLVKFDGEGSLKAYVDLAIGESFLIKGLRVVKGKNGVFVSMPRQQGKNGKWFDSVTAMTPQTKKEVDQVVMEAYEQDAEPAPR